MRGLEGCPGRMMGVAMFLFLGLGVIRYFPCIAGSSLTKIVQEIMFLSSLLDSCSYCHIQCVVQVYHFNRHGIVQYSSNKVRTYTASCLLYPFLVPVSHSLPSFLVLFVYRGQWQ